MTKTITLYTLMKEEVPWGEHRELLVFYEMQNNLPHSMPLHPYDEPMTGADAVAARIRQVPVHHYGRILSTGGKEEEFYALHPQVQELIERELRRKKYLSDETVNNIRAADSRLIQALSEEVRDLDERLALARKARETLDQRNRKWCQSYYHFVTAPLWRRLYVAIFSPRSITPK